MNNYPFYTNDEERFSKFETKISDLYKPHGEEFARPRPIWAIQADLRDVNAILYNLRSLSNLKDHYLREVADAFDRGDYEVAEIAASTYEEVAYSLPELMDDEADLGSELRRHPDFMNNELGRLTMILSGVTVSQERY